jgi:guanosine-3',5'-bis(diphosphate) 3'-pyrophosphohydrolase
MFEIEVRDLAQLTDVLATLKGSPGLSAVQRATHANAETIATLEWNGEPRAQSEKAGAVALARDD